jgi:signal transduction histidine kinase
MDHLNPDQKNLPQLLELQVSERTAELETRIRELVGSQQVIFSLGQASTPEMLLSLLIAQLQEKFGFDYVRIYLFEQPAQKLLLRQSAGMESLKTVNLPGYTEQTVFDPGRVSAKPVLLTINIDQPHSPNLQFRLTVPLKIGGRVMGGIDVYSPDSHPFTPHLISIFETIAEQLMLRLKNIRLLARTMAQTELLNRYTNQLRTAAELAHYLNTILEPDQLIEEVVNLVQLRFNLFHTQIYMLDSATESLVIRAGSGDIGQKLLLTGTAAIPLKHPHSLVAQAARTRVTAIGSPLTPAQVAGLNPLLADSCAQLAIPLLNGDQVFGVLDLHQKHPSRFSRMEVNTFNTLARQIATAIQNARYLAESKQVAQRLREMDRLKNEFLASMSHELRTPLNSIIGYSEILLMGINGELSPQAQVDVRAISDNGNHLMLLINDILDLAKIEAGSVKLQKEYVAIPYIFDNVQSRNAGLFCHKPVEFLVEMADNLPLIHVDPLRFGQILNNLVSNAVKFTESGYVKIRAFTEDEQVCIVVEDTGIGISPVNLEHIFEKFWQVDGSYARRAEGTGLGLTITRELVHLHQ